jgi:hypothetical protein
MLTLQKSGIPLDALHAIGLTALSFSLLGCSFFAESSFDLSPESRLPRWFTLPPGRSRADVSVEMAYYIDSSAVTAKFTLSSVKMFRRTLAEVVGKPRGLQPLTLRNPPPGSPPGYPMYEVITARGITEIIEHRKMEPIFYVTDDPAVWRELGVGTPP